MNGARRGETPFAQRTIGGISTSSREQPSRRLPIEIVRELVRHVPAEVIAERRSVWVRGSRMASAESGSARIPMWMLRVAGSWPERHGRCHRADEATIRRVRPPGDWHVGVEANRLQPETSYDVPAVGPASPENQTRSCANDRIATAAASSSCSPSPTGHRWPGSRRRALPDERFLVGRPRSDSARCRT